MFKNNNLYRYMAEEGGVEPTKHFNSTSTALKAAHTTGCDALPGAMIAEPGCVMFAEGASAGS